MRIYVIALSGKTHSIDVLPSELVESLTQKVRNLDGETPPNAILLTKCLRTRLEDGHLLSEYRILPRVTLRQMQYSQEQGALVFGPGTFRYKVKTLTGKTIQC